MHLFEIESEVSPVLLQQGIGLELLAQRAAINAEDTGCLALVAVRIIHHGLEQRSLDLANDQVVQIARAVAVERGEIGRECVFGVFTERLLAGFQVLFLLFLLN